MPMSVAVIPATPADLVHLTDTGVLVPSSSSSAWACSMSKLSQDDL
jgi:hypothetical protein